MKTAIEKASRHGCAISTVRGSNHFSTAAYYSLLAAEQDMIGVTMSNGSPRLAPWGGLEPIIGNNRLSVALPGKHFPIALDMANTATAMGRIRTCMREGLPLEPGWATDAQGNPTLDPAEAFKGLLMPIGGYKGVGISMIVDLLSAAASGSTVFSSGVRRVEDSEYPQNVSHFFLAFQVSRLVDIESFKDSIDRYVQKAKSVRRKADCSEIFVPGEIEWNTQKKRSEQGIPLSPKTIEQLNAFADQIGCRTLNAG
jgi:L-2-hydroxycarboxylate dehydrogenase (NAD+)